MKTTKLIQKGLMALLSIALMASLAMGQVFKNNGTLINTNTFNTGTFQNYRTAAGIVHNSGTIYATGNYVNSNATLNGRTYNQNQAGSTGGTINVDEGYTNSTGYTHNSLSGSLIRVGVGLTNTTAARFATDTGRVDYKNASTAQTILAAVKTSTYGGLTVSGGGGVGAAKTLDGSVTVVSAVDVAASSNLIVGAGNTLTVQAYPDAFTVGASGVVNANNATATVDYAAPSTNAQNIVPATYGNLTISGGTGTRTVSGTGGVTVLTALTNNSGTILDFTTHALDASAATSIVNTGGTIQTQGSVTLNSTPPSIAGTFKYQAASGTQSIGAATYSNLTLEGGATTSGQKDFPTGTVTVAGVYAASGADRYYGLTTSTFAYGGSAASVAQSVVGGESYHNLTITGASDTTFTVAGHKKAAGNFSVGGALTIAANNVLDMASSSITSLGSGANSGKIMWASGNTYVAGAGFTEFYAENTATVAAGTGYGILLFTGSGTKTIAGIVTAGPGTTLGNGVEVYDNLTVSGTLTVNGDLQNDGSISNSGTITVQ